MVARILMGVRMSFLPRILVFWLPDRLYACASQEINGKLSTFLLAAVFVEILFVN
jgi:hypothetical protein